MYLFSLAMALLAGTSGIYLVYRASQNIGYITRSEVSFGYLIKTSIIAGGGGTFLVFSIIMVAGFLDKTHIWTFEKFLGAIIISLIIGGVITIGSFVQAVMTTKYRRVLFDFLKRKYKDK